MQPHDFWQEFSDSAPVAPYTDRFPAHLPDGRILTLPIRALGDTGNAIASLILNQSSFEVEGALAGMLAEKLHATAPEVIVGLPTLGLSLARLVAQRLGHRRFVALGTSRKFWYDPDLSVPMRSITSPGAEKRLYVDPRMVPLLAGKRVVLIDDVISSGTSICAGLAALALIGVTPVAVGAAMLQTRRWHDRIGADYPDVPDRVMGAFTSPLLKRQGDGWIEDEG
ncbi:phosphoribosyltransferase [Oceaniglobus trochenteri]|uniref:phosphoribosyltransferase n=1 Tax=Oceaniglobus trochenteri TaxID=2763260 RepID=UPI001CFF6F34|nr:phosphoribosyltransferase [Oceaniglobus trochenteri]